MNAVCEHNRLHIKLAAAHSPPTRPRHFHSHGQQCSPRRREDGQASLPGKGQAQYKRHSNGVGWLKRGKGFECNINPKRKQYVATSAHHRFSNSVSATLRLHTAALAFATEALGP